MPEIAARLPCPACLGVMMDQLKPVKNADLTIDTCRRCGGAWFDAGEVLQLRQTKPRSVDRMVTLRETAYRMPCHACHAPMDRNADACPACGWKNRLDCPVCQKPMERMVRDELVLDGCRRCRGVWFDNHELAQIWNLEMTRRPGPPRRNEAGELVADVFLFETLLWAPDLMFIGAHGVVHGSAAVAEGAGALLGGGAAEAAGGAFESVGDAAGGVFETIAEIIGGLFG